jgi:hypothetical protein
MVMMMFLSVLLLLERVVVEGVSWKTDNENEVTG